MNLRPVCPFVLIAFAAACSPPSDSAASQVAQSSGARVREAPKIRTELVVQREMLQTLELSTDLESENEVQLRPRQPGTVTEVLAEEGDSVVQGQILARLDNRQQLLNVRELEVALKEARQANATAALAMDEARGSVATAKLARDQAERDHERNLRLFKGDENAVASALSQQALEASALTRDQAIAEQNQLELGQKRAELDVNASLTAISRAEVALLRAQADLEEMTIVSPFDGVVAERMIRVGQNVGADPIFALTDPTMLRAVFFRPQRELAVFGTSGETRLDVRATAEALPELEFRGEIVRVAPTIDPASGNFRVTAVLENEHASGQRLLPGMLVRLEITTERHPDALVVPKRAVRREGDQAFLFAEADGTVRRIEFVEGFTDDNHVEVLLQPGSKLAAGDAVVVVGNRDLEDGMRVRVENAEPIESAPEDAEAVETDEVATAGSDEAGA